MTNPELIEAKGPGESTELEPSPAKATNAPAPGRRKPRILQDEDAREGLDLPEILCYEEIDRFLCALEGIEDLLAARLMLMGGLRVSEACAVRPVDLRPDPIAPAVFVNQGKGAKDRYAPCDMATVLMARAWALDRKAAPDSPLITASTRTIQRHIEAAYSRAGIERGLGCHSLRHTAATWMLDKGIPLEVVRANLGHEDIATTQIYLHLDIRRRSRIYVDATRFGV